MRYLTSYRPETGAECVAPSPEHMAAMGEMIQEWMANGVLLDTQPLTPRDRCARLRLAPEFAIEGWAGDLGVQLLVAAVALAVGSRAILYVLARE